MTKNRVNDMTKHDANDGRLGSNDAKTPKVQSFWDFVLIGKVMRIASSPSLRHFGSVSE